MSVSDLANGVGEYSQELVDRGQPSYPFPINDLPLQLGRYELRRVLGAGGMGTVYRAFDSILQREVAVKVPNRAVDRELLHRLFAEARASATINHPSVCSIFDIQFDEHHPHLVMELIAGPSLDQMLQIGTPMRPRQAVLVAKRIAAGVHAAHQRGVIHRDLKPANILMRGNSDPVITDFGLACRSEDRQVSQCRLAGSPAYMAPEQVRGQIDEIGPATDVYGLGTILYELITGRRLFEEPVPSIYSHILLRAPDAPSTHVAGVDSRLDQICLRALRKEPSKRYASALEFCQVLDRYLRSTRKSNQPEPVAFPRIEHHRPVRYIHRPTPVRESKARLRKIDTSISFLFGAVLCVAVLGAALWSIQKPDELPSEIRPNSQMIQVKAATYPSESQHVEQLRSSVDLSPAIMRRSDPVLSLTTTNQTQSDEITNVLTSYVTPTSDRRVEFRFSESIKLEDSIIHIDGQPWSGRQLSDPILLGPGEHTLVMHSPEAKSVSHSFELPPSELLEHDETTLVQIPVDRRMGFIRIRMLRLNSTDQLTLDGELIPLTKLSDPLELCVGRHHLKLEREGHARQKTFWVVEGHNPDLRISSTAARNANADIQRLYELNQGGVFEWSPPEFPLRAGELNVGNALGMRMVWCPGEGGYWIGQSEVTRAQWKLVCDRIPWMHVPAPPSSERAYSLTWREANEFAKRLTEIERARGRIGAGWEYALPTQSQWQYAMLAGRGKLNQNVNDWGIRFRRPDVPEWLADGNLQNLAMESAEQIDQEIGFRVVLQPVW